jgi:hypothetical protein
MFSTSIDKTNFIPPFTLEEGLNKTLKYEFVENNTNKKTFYSE